MDDEQILRMALDYDIIDRKSLSHRINQAMVDVQHSVNNDDVDCLYELSKSVSTQDAIPPELFMNMVTHQ